MNNIVSTKKIRFTMKVAGVLEFLVTKLIFVKENKRISVDILSKLLIVLHLYFPALAFLKAALKTFLNVFHYDYKEFVILDDMFEERSVQYQKYLVAKNDKPSKVKKNVSREEASRPKNNNNFSASCNLITQYNPLLPKISSHEMLQIFPENTTNFTYI